MQAEDPGGVGVHRDAFQQASPVHEVAEPAEKLAQILRRDDSLHSAFDKLVKRLLRQETVSRGHGPEPRWDARFPEYIELTLRACGFRSYALSVIGAVANATVVRHVSGPGAGWVGVLDIDHGCPRFATGRSVLLLTVAGLPGGCATHNAVLEARKRHEEFGCSQDDLVNMPAYARYFDAEVMPEESFRPSRKALVGSTHG